MKNNATVFSLTVLIYSIMLTSCTKNESISSIPNPVITQMHPTDNSLNKLLDYANSSADNQQQFDYLLQAASMLINQGNELVAEQFLINLPDNMSLPLLNQKHLLLSQIYLHRHKTSKAMQELAKININILSRRELIFFFKISSRAYTQKGDWYNSATSLIKIDGLLSEDIQLYNKQQIFYLLAKMKKFELYTTSIENNNLEFKNWLKIANLYKQYLRNPELLTQKLKQWQYMNKNHPLTNLFTNNIVHNIPGKEINIALFLPLSGNFSKAGKIIREGVMSALFNYQGNKKYYVTVYDTADELSINELYKKASDNKISFIIGPLTKDNVVQMYAVNKAIENIVLNYPDKDNIYSPYIYQFSLNLSQETNLVAYKAYNAGHRRAFIIWQGDKWGEKLKNSFIEAWQKLGGTVVDDLIISKEYPINKNLVHKLGLSDSHNRKNQLQLGLPKIKFYPITRQDIDIIFLATNSNSSRQIVPLLKFNYANKVPVYGTSSVYKGSPKIIRDKDLNQVIFCDMPDILKLSINKNYREWPDQLNSRKRLFNIGYDAFTLMSSINILKNANLVGLNLKSGHAYLANDNRVIRNLEWAKFHNGKPIKYNG